jgi:hypothetical protein
MKSILRLITISAALLPLFAGDDPLPRYSINVNGNKPPRNVLSNEGIVLLSDAGYDEDFLADIIVHKQTVFDTTVEGSTYLANHGISERIIRFMIANERKSAGPVVMAVAPVAQTVVRGRVVQQKVLVPENGAYRQPVAQPAAYSGAVYTMAPAQSAYPSQPPVAASYAIVEGHWYGDRWYIVNPSYTPAALPMQPQWQFQQGGFQRASYFPVH